MRPARNASLFDKPHSIWNLYSRTYHVLGKGTSGRWRGSFQDDSGMDTHHTQPACPISQFFPVGEGRLNQSPPLPFSTTASAEATDWPGWPRGTGGGPAGPAGDGDRGGPRGQGVAQPGWQRRGTWFSLFWSQPFQVLLCQVPADESNSIRQRRDSLRCLRTSFPFSVRNGVSQTYFKLSSRICFIFSLIALKDVLKVELNVNEALNIN